MSHPKDLPEESLASLDASGARLFVYPASVKGLFQRRRQVVQFVLMLIFLVLPWVEIGGHQAILVDIPNRQFAFFGLTFWAHDGPLIFFILAGLTVGLAFATAVFGRVWCGWACPQTVFIEAIFRQIETFIEGNHIQRRRLDEADMSPQKAFKKFSKWTLYILASLVVTHSFLAYFVGTEELLKMIQRPPSENWNAFLFMVVIAGLILFDFAWFREQFCIIMCPYGRFQSVLMDKHSMAVTYDETRGEPRKGIAASKQEQGDCINCYKCVAVCPTAIDIRRGLQMECIACTACMDACDEVMEKIKKPKGLIRYSNETMNLDLIRNIKNPRALLYLAVLIICISGLSWAVIQRDPFRVSVVRAIEEPYQFLEQENKLINHFNLNVMNNQFDAAKLKFEISDPGLARQIAIAMPLNPLTAKPGTPTKAPIFLKFPPQVVGPSGKKIVMLKVTDGNDSITLPVTLLGPLTRP